MRLLKSKAFTLPGPKPTKQIGVTVAHGLLSFDSGWQRAVVDWGNQNTDASWSSLDYFEGLLGWGHAQHVADLAKMLRDERALRPNGQQHFCGHSNGCRLLLECLTANPNILLDDVHLIAAWAQRDCVANGINALLASGQVKRFFLYVSANDDVLWLNFISGRTLGKWGPTGDDPTFIPFAMTSMPPSFTQATQFNNNIETHCAWVDPVAPNGFNMATFGKIASISLTPAV